MNLNHSTIRVRRARPPDLNSLTKLRDEFQSEVNLSARRADRMSLKRDLFAKKPRTRCWIAENRKALIGYILIQNFYDPDLMSTGVHICDVFVQENWRRKRVATALVGSVLVFARRYKKPFVWWVTEKSNGAARSFYDSIATTRRETISYAWTPISNAAP